MKPREKGMKTQTFQLLLNASILFLMRSTKYWLWWSKKSGNFWYIVVKERHKKLLNTKATSKQNIAAIFLKYSEMFVLWCSGDNESIGSSALVVSRFLWPGNRTFLGMVAWWIVFFLRCGILYDHCWVCWTLLSTLITDLNLLSWSSTNFLAIALGDGVYLWNASTGSIAQLLEQEDEEPVTALSWISEGNILAVANGLGAVQVRKDEIEPHRWITLRSALLGVQNSEVLTQVVLKQVQLSYLLTHLGEWWSRY